MANNVEKLFAEALRVPRGPEREAFLQRVTQKDANLLTELKEMLRIHDEAGNFLEVSLPDQDPTLLASDTPAETDGIEQKILQWLERDPTGESLGRIRQFTILSQLGLSRSAIVFRARDEMLHREVAIKVLNPQLAIDPEHHSRFLSEAQAIAAIHHDNVISVFEVSEFRNLPFFVMEYFPAGSLQTHLSTRGPLSYLDALRIGKQLADGLAAAHRAGLLHRDVKPSNVLVDAFPDRVKLSDFGLVCSMQNEGRDPALGTPQYSSPEQILGKSIDHRADLFGLGCLLYALLVGKSPFAGTSVFQMLELTLDTIPEPFERFAVQVPREFQQLIFQLVEKDPERRPESIIHVAGILQRLLDAEQKPRSTRRSWFKFGAGLVATAGLLTTFRWLNSGGPVVLPANQQHLFTLHDGQLDPFFYSSHGATLVLFEELIIREPIHYWRVERAGTWGEVVYRFPFNQPLTSCQVNLFAFASFGLDTTCEVSVQVGPKLNSLTDALHFRRERCEFWPTPGSGPSFPDMPNLGLNTIRGPLQKLNLTNVMRGRKDLFVKARLFASKDLPANKDEQGRSLGPAAAQFLRYHSQKNEVPLVIDVRGNT